MHCGLSGESELCQHTVLNLPWRWVSPLRVGFSQHRVSGGQGCC